VRLAMDIPRATTFKTNRRVGLMFCMVESPRWIIANYIL